MRDLFQEYRKPNRVRFPKPGPHENDEWLLALIRTPFEVGSYIGSTLCEPEPSNGRHTPARHSGWRRFREEGPLSGCVS